MPILRDDHIRTHLNQRKKNFMNTRRSIACGTLAVLLVAMVISIATARNFSLIPTGEPTPAPATTPDVASYSAQALQTPFHYTRIESPGVTRMEDLGVDCIGNGASCEGYLNGSRGEVRVTNNINPPYYWRLKLTCEFGGNKYSDENPPSAGTVPSEQYCDFGAPARYWNVLVVHKP
ncbi:MAG: hypothetical protein ACRDTA_06300 [Pseudonocardiaceae bacterium]